ncbi:MAG: ankyrin repeat domain-containing protein [Nitrospirae bacterium]|nr:ankyrin repeat domain-containing protein [Nitrospirota bacterium]
MRIWEAGADVNAHNKSGFTALRIASAEGYTDITKLLIEAGADVDTKGRGGRED